MKKAHFLQHVPYEELGYIRDWLSDNSYQISSTKFFNNETLPDINDIDLLIIMGGPMSIHDEGELPWLIEEKKFLKEAIDKRAPTIGICLGAQLIADALGAKVYAGPHKEVGWGNVDFPPNQLTKIDSLEVLHWHGETFDLPNGAELIATNEAYKNQAFIFDNYLLGFQFHFEMTEEGLRDLVDVSYNSIEKSSFVQNKEDIVYQKTKHQWCKEELFRILDHFVALARGE